MVRRGFLGFLVVALVMAAGPLWAQVSTTGEIVGVVKADDGTVLSGATVTVEGSALIQKSISVTADNNGAFRFLQLTPGTYIVRAGLKGFETREYRVTVNVGRTASVPVMLSVGGQPRKWRSAPRFL